MNTAFFKKTGIVVAGIFGIIYAIFLLAPLIISPIANGYIPMLNAEIKKATGFNSKIEGFSIITTPRLTVGVKIKEFNLLTPDNKEVLEAKNFIIKMSLLPLLVKKIEIDLIQLESFDLVLGVNKDGSFEIEKYFVSLQDYSKTQETEKSEAVVLPFGLRLSNHLPDIKLGEFDIELVDLLNGRKYEIEGDKTEILDFVLNRGFKFNALGKVKLAGSEQFSYKLKIDNAIMPDLNLHELVFAQNSDNKYAKNNVPQFEINILDIFKGIYNNKITANLDANLALSKSGNSGYVRFDNLSIIELPPSFINVVFKGYKTEIDSNLYTAADELSTLKGIVNKNNIDLNFKSKAELNNLIRIVNALATTFNIKDLQTLSAKGKLDADFNIKSNLKTINSNGYFRIPDANIYYGLYKIGIDSINADIELANNNIDIKNVGFSILNQPLKFFGRISKEAEADLHLLAENLSLKGLLIACGQATLLKENPVNSGSITLKADIVGRLNKIKPTAQADLNNIEIKNIPSNTTLKLPSTNVNIIADGQSFSGIAISENIKIINPVAMVSVPKVTVNIKPDVIEIFETPVKVEKNDFNVSGRIKNYLSEKIALEFISTGDIKAKLSGDVNLLKQALNLVFATTSDSTIIIPMFDKSSMTFNGHIGISGNMLNPVLVGTVNVPMLSIPEIPVVMENLVAKLNGPILKGHVTVKKFASGGIVAENCSTDFLMKGVNFYLNNLKGIAFDGKILGNIIYNMSTLLTTIDFHGSDMNAEKAVKGAIGLSNALSGVLNFDTKLSLKALDYEDMIRSMKGNLTFKIGSGSFGNIGRIENLLGAGNIVANNVLKTTVATLSNLNPIKDTAKYDYITGDMNFSNGWANIDYIKSSGKTLSYFVYGKLNIINMSTNIVILGRLDSYVIRYLGPIGEFSVDKILSNIPVLGSLTSSLAHILTTDPMGERVSEIPALSNNSNSYKDFKVIFNGGIDSKNSIKSFKWLTKVDTTAIETQSVTDTIKSLKSTVGDDVKNVIDTVKNQKDALKSTANELKSLFKF